MQIQVGSNLLCSVHRYVHSIEYIARGHNGGSMQKGTMGAILVQFWFVGKVQYSVIQKGPAIQLIVTYCKSKSLIALSQLQHHVQNIDNVVHCISICTGIVVQCISFACIEISTVCLYLLVSLVIECCRRQCCEMCIWICL